MTIYLRGWNKILGRHIANSQGVLVAINAQIDSILVEECNAPSKTRDK